MALKFYNLLGGDNEIDMIVSIQIVGIFVILIYLKRRLPLLTGYLILPNVIIAAVKSAAEFEAK